MNFDPQKFFIGLMDFFSILRPDALLTFLLVGLVDPTVLGDRYAKLARARGSPSCSRVISSTTWPPYSASDWMSCTIWFNCS